MKLMQQDRSTATAAVPKTTSAKAMRDGASSLSSSLKKKILSQLGKLKNLKGLPKGSAQRKASKKTTSGLSDLDEERETAYEFPTPAAPAVDGDSANSSVAALLRQCQRATGSAGSFVGTVPVVSLGGLQQGLQGAQHAVLLLQVGGDTSCADAAPNSIKHCSRELPSAVQQRVANNNTGRSAGDSRLPGFSLAFSAARRASAERRAAGARGASAALGASVAAAPAPAGAAANADTGYLSIPLSRAEGALQATHLAQGPSLPASSSNPVTAGSGRSAPITASGGASSGTGPGRGPLRRGMTSPISAGLFILQEAGSSAETELTVSSEATGAGRAVPIGTPAGARGGGVDTLGCHAAPADRSAHGAPSSSLAASSAFGSARTGPDVRALIASAATGGGVGGAGSLSPSSHSSGVGVGGVGVARSQRASLPAAMGVPHPPLQASGLDSQRPSAMSQAALALPTVWLPAGLQEAAEDDDEEAVVGDLDLEEVEEDGRPTFERRDGASVRDVLTLSGGTDAAAAASLATVSSAARRFGSCLPTGSGSDSPDPCGSANPTLCMRSSGPSDTASELPPLPPGLPAPPVRPFVGGLQIGSIAEAARAVASPVSTEAPAVAPAGRSSGVAFTAAGCAGPADGWPAAAAAAGAPTNGAHAHAAAHRVGHGAEEEGDGLETLFASPSVGEVLGAADPARLRATLAMLFCGNPSLQLILEDIIRSALAGRAVVHEQLLVCPRSPPAAAAAGPQAAAAANSGSCVSLASGSLHCPLGTYGDSPGPSADKLPQMHLARNPLDDFLLLQVTACYLGDHRPTGHSEELLPSPGELPALFLTLSRPYAAALAAAAQAASAATAAASAARAAQPSAGPGAAAGAPAVAPSSPSLRRQSTQQSGFLLARSSSRVAADNSGKVPVSPGLGSLFGSLGKPSWMRPFNTGPVVGSPGASPRHPAGSSQQAMAAATASAFERSSMHAEYDASHRQPSSSSAATSTQRLTPNGGHDSGGTIGGAPASAELARASVAVAAAAERPAPLRLPEASAAALEGLCSRLRLETSLLAQVPAAVTVLSLDGQVVYQNGRSVAYMGYAVGAPVAPGLDMTDPEHALQRIFACDTPALESMWEAVHAGKVWSGLVCMPHQVELGNLARSSTSDHVPALDMPPPAVAPRNGHTWTSGLAAASGSFVSGASPGGALLGSPGTDMLGQMLPSLRRAGTASSSIGSGSLACLSPARSGQAAATAAVAGGGGVAVPVPGAATGLASAAAAPQDIRSRRSGHGASSFSPQANAAGATGSLPLTAFASGGAAGTAVAAAAATVGAGGKPAAGSLPRNTSAPVFRGNGGVGSPLPSVLESEACTGGAAAVHNGFTGVPSTYNCGGEAAFGPFTRNSWCVFRTPSAAAAEAMYCSSPLGGASADLPGGGGAAAVAHVLPPPSQHLLPGQRRTRIHRSNSLARTEQSLDGSYRAMRLAASVASAASQSLLAGGAAPAGWSGSHASVEGFSVGSPRFASEMLSLVPSAALPPPSVPASSAAALAMVTSAPVPGAARRDSVVSAASGGVGGASGPESGGAVPSWREALLGAASGRGGARALRAASAFSPIARTASGPTPDGLARAGSNTSASGAAAAAAMSGGVPYAVGAVGSSSCWHEIQANLVLDPVSCEWQLVLINQDVTAYVQAELEVLHVLDAEHRILEEVFPRHVLEAMTLDKRRASALGTGGSGSGLSPRPMERTLSSTSAQAQAQALAATSPRGLLPPRNGSSGGGAGRTMAVAAAAAIVAPGNGAAQPPPWHGSARPAAPTAATGTAVPPAAAAALPGAAPAAAAGAAAAATAASEQPRGVSMNGGSGHLGHLSSAFGASASLASYNYSVFTGGGVYDSYDERGSYSHSLYTHSEHIRTLDGSSARLSAAAAFLRSSRPMANAQAAVAAAAAAVGAGSAAAAPPPPPQATPPQVAETNQQDALHANDSSCGVNAAAASSGSAESARLQGGIASMGDLQQYMARSHEEVTVLFADIASFTSMCGQVPPGHVMAFLNDLFTTFDQLVEQHHVYKVETIGDCYMVCGGLMEEDEEGFRSVTEAVDPYHAHKVFAFAADMLSAASSARMPGTGLPVKLRVGIHSGPVMSGVVGRKMPRFCLFGDTVNTASRMESTGTPGCVHISASTRALLGGIADGFAPTGGMEVKGKGFMYTYLYDPSGCSKGQQTPAAALEAPPPFDAGAAAATAPSEGDERPEAEGSKAPFP